MMTTFLRDLRFALRSLGKAPALTAVAVVSLGLGIGANTAVFTLFDQVLLRSLPVQDPGALVMVATRGTHIGSNRGSNSVSYPMYKDYRERNEVFDGVLCRRGEVVNVAFKESTERAEAEMASGNYFEVLGIRPAWGRLFTMDDETAPGANPVVVLSYDYWSTRFGADRSVVGQPIRVNGTPMTIVGVVAPRFHGLSLGRRPQLYVPVTMKKQVTPSWDDLDDRRSRWVQVFARLRPGVTLERAESSIGTLYKQIIAVEVEDSYFADVSEYGRERFLESHAIVIPGSQGYSNMRQTLEMPLRLLMILVGLVLLISCANVSNLMVAKATSRTKEIAMRLALGAGRRRILKQLLVESLVLAIAGGALGLLVATIAGHGLIALAPTEQARTSLSAVPDARVLTFTLVVSMVAALGFGLLPALQATRTDLVSTIKHQSGAATGVGGTRLRKALVVFQVFVALLLLLGSALFVQSLVNLHDVDPGFRATNLVRFKLDPMMSGYDVARTKRFFADLRDSLEALPGVESAGLAVVAIMEGDEWDSTVNVEGYEAADGENMNPHFNAISPGYFETLGLAIEAGRDFDARDADGSKKVVAVNRTFAEKYFEDGNALGYHIGFGGGIGDVPDMEIVAIVQDAKYEDLRDEIPRQVFVAYAQNDWATEMTTYVRTSLPSKAIFDAIRQAVRRLDATMPIFDMNSMEDQLDQSLSVERLVAFLSTAFGVLATVLAFVGLYGVTAFGVARRAPEIGLRMALGAEANAVVRMVLREVFSLVAVGVALALPVAWWLSELVRSQLYGVAPRDPWTMALATIALVAVAFLAGSVPAMRASRLSPVSVLRYD
ncbi:MAG TPA: ABC transporter permease [Vicinamibacteria bacterium]|nr:ABC transporter permease [Vicinamibacteria bacterium]